MRILVYGINFAPELTGIGKYTGEMCSWLAARGHEVRVVTAPPYYPEWRVRDGYSSFAYRPERIDGVSVTRCPVWVPRSPTGKTRLLHLASFAVSSFPAALLKSVFWRPDVVFSVEPAFFTAPGAWAAARLSGARAWLHVQDFELDAAFDLGLVRSGALKSLACSVERFIMRRFDAVSTISGKMVEKLESKSVAKGNRYFFPNWVDTDVIFPMDRPGPMRKEMGIADDSTVLLYSGNMGEKQGLEIIVETARALSHRKELVFVVCGEGVSRKRLVESARDIGNIRFYGLQPAGKLNELLNMADIHLLPQRAAAEDLVMPSKILGIFSSGRPVIATAKASSQLAEAVEGRGVVVEPGDREAFTKAVLGLSGDRGLRVRLGKKAREYAMREWGKETVLGRFEKELLRRTS